MTRLWIARLAWPVRSLGPGRRAALWVSGCRRRCPGCTSPELWDRGSGRPLPVDRLFRRLASLPIGPEDLDGLTISGGEPFDQAAALAELVRGVHARLPRWDVMAYTGFTIDEIRSRVPHGEVLLSELDALIDGPYVAGIPASDPWRGSGNQRLHVLSERGRVWSDAGPRHDPMADVGLGPGGSAWILGVPRTSRRHAIRRILCATPRKLASSPERERCFPIRPRRDSAALPPSTAGFSARLTANGRAAGEEGLR